MDAPKVTITLTPEIYARLVKTVDWSPVVDEVAISVQAFDFFCRGLWAEELRQGLIVEQTPKQEVANEVR